MRYSISDSNVSIRAIQEEEYELLIPLAIQTFIESHGHSAPAKDIAHYLSQAFSQKQVLTELSDNKNIFHFLLFKDEIIGYSKIILNQKSADSRLNNCTKLERIYLLQSHHNLKLGAELLKFNIDYSKRFGDRGMWLFTWTENHQAIKFYDRFGFTIIGSYNFKISPNHSNPNHRMFLRYSSFID